MDKKAFIVYGAIFCFASGFILLGLEPAVDAPAAELQPEQGQDAAQTLQFSYNNELDGIVRDYLRDMDPEEDGDGQRIARHFGEGRLAGEDFDPKLLFVPAGDAELTSVTGSDTENATEDDNQEQVIHLANLGNTNPAEDAAEPGTVPQNPLKTEFTAEDYLLATKLTQLENWDPADQGPVRLNNQSNTKTGALQNLVEDGRGDGQQFYTKKSVKTKSKTKKAKAAKNKKPVYHTVKGGDSLWGISNKYGVSLSSVVKLNPDIQGSRIYPGNKILVKYKTVLSKPANYAASSKKETAYKAPAANAPAASAPAASAPAAKKYGYKKRYKYHRVKSGDTLSRLARRYGTSVGKLKSRNKLKSSTIYVGQRLFIKTWYKKIEPSLPPPDADYKIVQRELFTWPVRGRITSRYGFRRDPFNSRRRQFHGGVDIGAAMYTPIKAAGDGIVIYADRKGGYGNTVSIRHPHGFVTFYSHMAEMDVKKGDIVKKGQQIGTVGRTGNVTAAHIHFEMKRWLKPVNPVPMFDRSVAIRIPKNEPQVQPATATPDDAPSGAAPAASSDEPGIIENTPVKEAKKEDSTSKNPS